MPIAVVGGIEALVWNVFSSASIGEAGENTFPARADGGSNQPYH
jgi:hypothetical protein